MIYIVAGLRSGTSMMMDALRAGGMELAYSESREAYNWRDDQYQPNAGGFFELPTTEHYVPGWPRQYDGKVVKCLVRWLRHLSSHEYRVVFMLRHAEEIRQSHRAARFGELDRYQIDLEVEEARRMLAERRDVKSVTCIDYGDMIFKPHSALESLNWPIDISRAATVVRPAEYRFELPKLTVGL